MAENEPNPSFVEVVERTIAKFWSKRAFTYRGHPEPYNTYKAASDTIRDLMRKTRIPPLGLATKMVQSTSLKPSDIDLNPLLVARRWDDFFVLLAEGIIAEEAIRNDPNIKPEEDRRLNEIGDW